MASIPYIGPSFNSCITCHYDNKMAFECRACGLLVHSCCPCEETHKSLCRRIKPLGDNEGNFLPLVKIRHLVHAYYSKLANKPPLSNIITVTQQNSEEGYKLDLMGHQSFTQTWGNHQNESTRLFTERVDSVVNIYGQNTDNLFVTVFAKDPRDYKDARYMFLLVLDTKATIDTSPLPPWETEKKCCTFL